MSEELERVMREGDPTNWDNMSATLDAAKFAVWSFADDPEKWERTTIDCVDVLCSWFPASHARILDVGCGIGRLTFPIAQRYPDAEVVGVDVSEGMLHWARERESQILFVLGDGLHVPPGPFDVAYTVVVFQHNRREVCAALVASVARVLKPGGRFVYQLIGDMDIEDEAHVPTEVATSWATDVGLTIVATHVGMIFPDWLWIVAEKP